MAKKKSSGDDFPEALKPFRFHGVFQRSGPYLRSGRDYIGECPFCGKKKAFAVNRDTGQWACHSKPRDCGRSGNIPTFLHQFAEDTHKHTRPQLWTELSRLRKRIPVEAFKQWGVGWDYKLKRWVVPVRAKDGGIVDLRVYSPKSKKKMGTAGRAAGCWNLAGASEIAGPDAVLFICEGEWDGMALHWLLDQLGLDFKWAVIALPGARTVKDEWISVVKKFGRVVTLGDNDSDGDAMAEKIWSKLAANGYRGNLQYLNWPDTLPEGHDVTDHIGAGLAAKLLKRKIWKTILRLVDSEHRRQPFKGQDNVTAALGGRREAVERPATNPTFEETVKVYQKHLMMTHHHIMALQYSYAIYLATQWDDDPLWGFLVGVPGSGKTEILCSIDGCPEAIYYSSIQSKGLVSGFQANPDPSLIPEMIGRCSIFKDFTELLDGNEEARDETYGVLRGWYDGHVKRKFGNGVEREYYGRGNVIGGVTNIIHAHNNSTLGERFIKFQMPKPKRAVARQIVMRAILNTAQEEKKNTDLRAAANAFLNRNVPAMVPAEVIPMKYMVRIAALADLVSFMRAKVDWSGYGYEKELSHRPEAELPTRLGKQLTKLAMSNAVVLGKKKVDEDVFKLVERVAFNTAHGFHLDIVQAAMTMNEGKNLMIEDLVEGAKMPKETLKKRLDDLVELSLMNKTAFRTGVAGRPHTKYTLVRSIRELWREADVKEDHVGDIVDARRTREGWEDREDD